MASEGLVQRVKRELPTDLTRPDLAIRPDGPVLALIGLPADVAEPVCMLAEILGWRITLLPAAPVASPAALLCIAMLPAGDARPPWAVWSPDHVLNEHISGAGLSVLDHPPCLNKLESLLNAVTCRQGRRQHSSHARQFEKQPQAGRPEFASDTSSDVGIVCNQWPIGWVE
jgi:hypothetical protein